MQHRAELDGIRGIACLSVILLHCVVGIVKVEPGSTFGVVQKAVQPFLVGGVDLFFVLSGFLIGGILIDNKGSKNYFKAFWIRRIGRIFPVYYLMLAILGLLYVADYFYNSPYISGLLFNQLPFWVYATFIQNIYMLFAEKYGNFLGVTWSLAVEEQFYLVLPFVVALLSRRRIMALAVAAILAAPLVRTLVWELYGWKFSYHLTPARMDTIMWGVLVACLVRNGNAMAVLTKYRALIAPLIGALAALLLLDVFTHLSYAASGRMALFLSTLRYSALAAMYALIILRLCLPGAAPLKGALSTPLLTRIGLYSYAAYMYHQIINFTLHRAAHGRAPTLDSWSDAYIPAVVLCLTFISAALSYRYFEQPILKIARRVTYEPAQPVAVQPISAHEAKPVSA